MSYENPTPLRVGASGTLNGWRVRVAGRVVLSVDLEGETYFWNEFNLVDASGNAATLVYEEGDTGPEWKLFRAFTPRQPLTAREAASKQVGDKVNLDGTPIEVTLVDESRVRFIEGQAPEGVEVGDVARYFNADTGDRMLVASWTGDEIEFYEGLDMPADGVAAAFGFTPPSAPGTVKLLHPEAHPFDAPAQRSGSLVTKIVLVVLGVVGLFSARSCLSGLNVKEVVRPTAARRVAPPALLVSGQRGTLAQTTFTVTGQAVMEIGRASGRHERREYTLAVEDNGPALLINALSGGAKEWHLFRPVAAPAGLTPYDAAALRKGAPFALPDRTLPLSDLYLSRTVSQDGTSEGALPGNVEYGFVAGVGTTQGLALARWNEREIHAWLGQPLAEAEILRAFGLPPAKEK